MRDPNFKNPIYKVLLDESHGGLRALPKSVRFQLLLLPGWALAIQQSGYIGSFRLCGQVREAIEEDGNAGWIRQ